MAIGSVLPTSAAAPTTVARPAARNEAAEGAHGADQAASDKPAGPIQKLVETQKYQDALLEVDKLRKQAGPAAFADAESEYWAAKAELGLKLWGAARDRFQKIARTYPEHARGPESSLEAWLTSLRKIGDAAETPAERTEAAATAKELEALARKYEKTNAEHGLRAWYLAGNAWRLSGNDTAATAAYKTCRTSAGPGEYPAKCTYAESTLAARDFRTDDARKLVTECATRWSDTPTAERCRKSLARLDIVGSPAPPLTVETWLQGKPVDMSSLHGRVVLLWYFATWCPHCKETMPQMAERLRRYEGKPFTIIGLTNNTKDQTTETAKAFVAEPHWGITYPTAVDLAGRTSLAYQSTAVPAAVLVDKQGIVRWADHPTYLDDAMIDRLLAE
jgi:peroxiredoxin